MVKVYVGSEERDWKQVDQHWLCNQINGRRGAGEGVCVRIVIIEHDIDLTMRTLGCSVGLGGGGRPLTKPEAKIVDLWRKLHLDQPDFSCGNVHAFLVQLARLI